MIRYESRYTVYTGMSWNAMTTAWFPAIFTAAFRDMKHWRDRSHDPVEVWLAEPQCIVSPILHKKILSRRALFCQHRWSRFKFTTSMQLGIENVGYDNDKYVSK